MLRQRATFRLDQEEPGFDLAQATRAPRPQQVVEPGAVNSTEAPQAPLRLLLEIFGNVIAGGALLAFLLAAPALFGRLFGLA